MKKMSTHTKTILIMSLLLSSGFQQAGSTINRATWLLGTWENRTSRGSLYETWTRRSNNEFYGLSYKLKEQDTLVLETIQLLQKSNGLFYIPSVKDQNEGKAVVFALKSIRDDHMVFENPEHDFPQVISYKRITSDSLVAEISGNNNGKFSSRSFPMKRVY
jgi:hypothetical protein